MAKIGGRGLSMHFSPITNKFSKNIILKQVTDYCISTPLSSFMQLIKMTHEVVCHSDLFTQDCSIT